MLNLHIIYNYLIYSILIRLGKQQYVILFENYSYYLRSRCSLIMAMKKKSPFGSWESMITTDMISNSIIALGEISIDNDNIYWSEMRPSENGRTLLMCLNNNGEAKELLPKQFNIRNKVHEYGGGSFTVNNGKLFFIDSKKHGIFKIQIDKKIENIIPELIFEKDNMLFADFIYDDVNDCLFSVAEDQSGKGESKNMLVSITMDGQINIIASGADFYASPKLSPDKKHIMWIEWNHPNMPWDDTLLYQADIYYNGAAVINKKLIAGGDGSSVFQPEYSPNGDIFYVSDKSGFWNIYKISNEAIDDNKITHYKFEFEFGMPHWVFSMRCYDFIDRDNIIATYADAGDWRLAVLNLKTGQLTDINLPWCSFDSLYCHNNIAYFIGGQKHMSPQVVSLNLLDHNHIILQNSNSQHINMDDISIAEKIKFPTENGLFAYGYLYKPKNAEYTGIDSELPPLIIKSHGGPTGQAGCSFSAKIQYWTNRGFAVFDINYGGSTGFGREYRERLYDNWGITDVDDCVNGAKYLVNNDIVDGDRLIITGGSAGGYTTLSALAFRDIFKAGCSSYGIGDLISLAEDTHKFESRYLDKLIGKWPDDADIYRQRSPINKPDNLNCPIIFLQGEDDKVVPPNQAEMMVNILRDKKIPVAYLLFEGEGHGFRKAKNISHAIEAELSFYAQIFNFSPAGNIKKIQIDNL